jgi:hypothetical protein
MTLFPPGRTNPVLFISIFSIFTFFFSFTSCAPYEPYDTYPGPGGYHPGPARPHYRTFHLEGRVLDKYGSPLEDIAIIASIDDLERPGRAGRLVHERTDHRGFFSIPLKRGREGYVYINKTLWGRGGGRGQLNNARIGEPLFDTAAVFFSTPRRGSRGSDRDALFVRVERRGGNSYYLAPGEHFSIKVGYTRMGSEYFHIINLFKNRRYRDVVTKGRQYLRHYSDTVGSRPDDIRSFVDEADKRSARVRPPVTPSPPIPYDRDRDRDRDRDSGRDTGGDRGRDADRGRDTARDSGSGTGGGRDAGRDDGGRADDIPRDPLMAKCNNTIMTESELLKNLSGRVRGKCAEFSATLEKMISAKAGIFKLSNRFIYLTFGSNFTGKSVKGVGRAFGMFIYEPLGTGARHPAVQFEMLRVY